MTQMNCTLKNEDGSECGKPIDYVKDRFPRAKNPDGTPHIHEKKRGGNLDAKFKEVRDDISTVKLQIKSVENWMKNVDKAIQDVYTLIVEYKKGTGEKL